MNNGLYFDNHATTQVDPAIADGLHELLIQHVGNASSIDHPYGVWAMRLVDAAGATVARSFHANEKGVIFTSGATESANIAIRDLCRQAFEANGKVPVVIMSAVEHPCIYDTLVEMDKRGLCETRIVGVDSKARLDLDELAHKAEGALLGCFMAANNEVGTVYPVAKIGKLLHQHGVKFLCDATQWVGKGALDMQRSHVDYLIFSGHKIHAIQGVGCLVCLDYKNMPKSLYTGGSQQRGVRPGTYNVPGIWTLDQALQQSAAERDAAAKRMAELRDKLWTLLLAEHPELLRSGDTDHMLPNNLHFCVPDIENTMLIQQLHGKVALSTGSACSSGAVEPSRILTAMKVPRDLTMGAIRIGISRFTRENDIQEGAGLINGAIASIKEILGV